MPRQLAMISIMMPGTSLCGNKTKNRRLNLRIALKSSKPIWLLKIPLVAQRTLKMDRRYSNNILHPRITFKRNVSTQFLPYLQPRSLNNLPIYQILVNRQWPNLALIRKWINRVRHLPKQTEKTRLRSSLYLLRKHRRSSMALKNLQKNLS